MTITPAYQRIITALEEGATTLEALCKQVKVSPTSIYQKAKKHNIDLPSDLGIYRHRPEMDSLIDQGFSQAQIARRVDLTRERVRQYILYSGQYEHWQSKSQEREDLQKNTKPQFLTLLVNRRQDIAQSASWAEKMALLYKQKCEKHSQIPIADLISFLERYKVYHDANEPVSNKKLGNQRFNHVEVTRILNKLDLPTLSRYERNITTVDKKRAIQRSYPTILSAVDIAHFLNVPNHVVHTSFNKISKEKQQKRKFSFACHVGRARITHKLASQMKYPIAPRGGVSR